MNLRKLNRGLILGAVLIIGTAAYVVYDNARFNRSRDEIQSTVESYFDSMAQANIGDKDAMRENCTNLIDEQWAYDNSMEDYYYETKGFLLENIRSSEEEDTSTGYISEFECSTSNISVNKNGPDGAVVTLDLEAYIEFYGYPYALTPVGFEPLDNNNYESTDDYFFCNPDDTIKYRLTQGFEGISVYLKNTDGEWKITAIESYYWDGAAEIIEDENTNSEGGEADE